MLVPDRTLSCLFWFDRYTFRAAVSKRAYKTKDARGKPRSLHLLCIEGHMNCARREGHVKQSLIGEFRGVIVIDAIGHGVAGKGDR